MMNSSFALHAELILYNAKIITVDAKNTLAEAVAMKDGKIIAVGTRESVKSFGGDTTRWMDVEGKTVVPGFIDAHAHMDKTAANTKLAVSCHIPPVK